MTSSADFSPEFAHDDDANPWAQPVAVHDEILIEAQRTETAPLGAAPREEADEAEAPGGLSAAVEAGVIGPEAASAIAKALAAGGPADGVVKGLFEVVVRMRSGDLEIEWPARVIGMREELSEATHAFFLRVAVDEPWDRAIPGERPPLLRGSFCSVELRGAKRPGQMVIPRAAIRDGHVFLIDRDRQRRHRRRRRSQCGRRDVT